MLLAIDVGNSNNVIGLFSGDKLLTHWRIRTEWTSLLLTSIGS